LKSILIIEDNEYILEALAASLRARLTDCSFLTAVNGKEGLNILGSVSLDLILTDLEMPVLDGYGVIEYVNRYFPHIPLIVMTADATPKARKKLNALGISRYIEKPFDFNEIAGTIMNTLSAAPGVVDCLADPPRL